MKVKHSKARIAFILPLPSLIYTFTLNQPEAKILLRNLRLFNLAFNFFHHICILKLSSLYCLELPLSSQSSNGNNVLLSILPKSSSFTLLSTMPICFMINNLPLLHFLKQNLCSLSRKRKLPTRNPLEGKLLVTML